MIELQTSDKAFDHNDLANEHIKLVNNIVAFSR